jgi:glucan 1,3-beta-glucosidase
MVLEPWITPSLFYRFLGLNNTESQVAVDSYTFCESQGPEDGNKIMRAHWDTWYTEEHIKNISDRGV